MDILSIKNFKNIKLILTSILIAFVIILNLYMLSKVTSNSKEFREFEKKNYVKNH